MLKPDSNMSKTNSSKDIHELRNNYDDWANHYTDDLIGKMGYKVPEFAVQSFITISSKNDKILDVGSGTGIVGALLRKEGYEDIEALDLSEKMLAEAKRKQIYQAYHQQILGTALSLPSDFYDAMIAVGTFGPTHAPPHAFDELIRITKPNGYILFTMRENEIPLQGTFRTKMNALEKVEKWTLVKETKRFQGFTKQKTHLFFKTFIYKIIQ